MSGEAGTAGARPAAARPKPRLPRGLADRGPAEIAATERLVATIKESYALYGFEPVETPLIEYADALGKFLPDQDRPNEGVFAFEDDDGQWLSLRYDLTAPLARHVAENFERLAKPYRSYRVGWVFRNEKPGPGRFRQFMQFDADTVGAASVAADAEMCMMAADTLERLGIPRGDYVIKVNNRKVLDGVMEAAGLAGDENAGRRLTVLRAIDKFDRLGVDGVRALLGEGRKDESGDFTKGAGLAPSDIGQIVYLFEMDQPVASYVRTITNSIAQQGESADMLDDPRSIQNIRAGSILGLLESSFSERDIDQSGVQELAEIWNIISAAGYDDGRIRIDPSVVRGLEYYTGPVYEAELTFEVADDAGRPVRFGSVGGGGRYDGLVGRFRGEDVPATGFSIGVSRLQAALAARGAAAAEGPGGGPVVVLALDRDPAATAGYMGLVAELRRAGIAAELYLGGSGMKAQMKYADRRDAPCVVIQGSDERAKGEVTIKDLVMGKEMSAGIADNRTWREARPAQETVPAADLVAKVREIRARTGR